MAYTTVQSGEIPEGTQYYSGKLPLGDYNFYLNFDATGVLPKIVTKCESPDGEIRTAAAGTLRGNVQIRGWSVEANETEASVYVISSPDLPIVNSVKTFSCSDTYLHPTNQYVTDTFTTDSAVEMAYFFPNSDRTSWLAVFASTESGFTIHRNSTEHTSGDYQAVSATYGDQTYWYTSHGWSLLNQNITTSVPLNGYFSSFSAEKAAAAMLFRSYKRELLVTRFSINLGDAGGYPGGSGNWDMPGDWNPDPSTTLHLTVNGALSGRHNDPLHDTSYSYIPADNTTQAGYGCGGDGGHGGGGGGGASTVIIRQFATNKANSKDIVALAKRHGYGSGGGKGAKGGDGCILIYY